MKRAAFILLIITTVAGCAVAQEYRSAIAAEFRILPRLEAEVNVELRKIFLPESYFNRTFQGSLEYKISESLNIGTTYSYAIITEKDEYEDEKGDEAFDRNRLAADLVFQPKRFDNDLRISNRLRYQVSTVDDDESKQYLRNRIMLDYRISSAMNPYFALEPYYRFSSERINIVRLYIGNEMPLFKSKIDLYYIAEIHLDPDRNTAQYIIGLSVELDFKK